ncbi:MAG: hypothetical protein HC810_00640 [Acaryochloridaceae cyanobacterium RL_2_7]|nr:hypothetical protein [Acaryochloridaceae cyanobacterium RL_2_7]
MDTFRWQQLTVQDFVQNFQDILEHATELSQPEPSSFSLGWKNQRVKDFFLSFPWIPHITDDNQDEIEFSLNLSVQEYFQHFQWNAPIKISINKKDTDMEIYSPDLENFANLF